MRLLTHNMLQCNKKGVQNGFPLRIKASKIVYEETEFNAVFIAAMVRKVEYPALLKAIEDIRHCSIVREDGGPENMSDNNESEPVPELPVLPAELPDNWEDDEALLEKLHTILLDVLLIDGSLVCPESGREFPVEKGIPNMLLHDDEI
ncbi:unnamed protein product [Amoebophrya sp. A120]|nr:unnamed protein product [Amoebophrya sp. A120]|eukprot:GSA120T00006648001.1